MRLVQNQLDLKLKISDTNVKSLEPATKILLGSIVVIHKSLKRTVYCWQKRVGDYGLSREIKGSVIERLLEKYETLRQFLKTEEYNEDYGRSFEHTGRRNLQIRMAIEMLKNYQNWQMENIDEVLIEHLIDSKDQMGLYLLEEDRFEKILMA
ncbi:hypothetical protein BY996DRAFT_8399658, partial [Phakopsora pachyrhizi]